MISLRELETIVQNASDAFDKLAEDDAKFTPFVSRFIAHKVNELERRNGNHTVFEIR